MQFAEVLTPEEVVSVRRFVPEHSAAADALARKCQVISLTKTIENGGYTTERVGLIFKATVHLPKLAIAVPHRDCNLRLGWEDGPVLQSWSSQRSSRVMPRVSWHTQCSDETSWTAVAPPLPIEARRAISRHSESALVLWEANWQRRSMALDDPAIIVPLIEDLYAVVYTWDLTEVERRALQKASSN